MTASSAAGVAVAFGSPIGGVLFSIEVSALSPADVQADGAGNESNLLESNHVAELRMRPSCDLHLSCMIKFPFGI